MTMLEELDQCEMCWTKQGMFNNDDRQVIHTHEKHDDIIYSARNKKEILSAALCMVWQRMGNWYPTEKHEIRPTPFTNETIPKGLEAAAKAAIKSWEREVDWQERENEIVDLLKVVQAKSIHYEGLAAFRIIELRQDHDYETWCFEHLAPTEHWITRAQEYYKKRDAQKKKAS